MPQRHADRLRRASRCAASASAAAAPRGIAPDEIADRDEIGAGGGQRSDLVEARRHSATQGTSKTSAHQATRSTIAVERRPRAVGCVAEHHVVGAALGRDHGVVAGGEAAAAGDPRGLERLRPLRRTPRCPVRCAPSAPPRATSSAWPSSSSAMPCVLHDRRQRLDAVDLRALVAGARGAAARRRCRRRGERRGEVARERGRVRDRRRHRDRGAERACFSPVASGPWRSDAIRNPANWGRFAAAVAMRRVRIDAQVAARGGPLALDPVENLDQRRPYQRRCRWPAPAGRAGSSRSRGWAGSRRGRTESGRSPAEPGPSRIPACGASARNRAWSRAAGARTCSRCSSSSLSDGS